MTRPELFGVAIYHPKHEVNVGSLWRTAHILGASFIATVGERYKRQASDTTGAALRLPLWHFATLEDMRSSMPRSCQLVGVELTPEAHDIATFTHPPRCIYLLGAEDHGLPPRVLDLCHRVVRLPGSRSLNVAVAGSIVVHDRVAHQRIGWAS